MLTAHVFVDLFRVVKQAVLVGAERYSIKNLEPLYGFKREIELRDANSSIVEFENLLEKGDPGGELKELIRGYNADDCVSTEQLRDWLEQRRTQAEQQFGVELPRASKGVPKTTEEFTARQAAVHALEERLQAGIAADPTNRSEADQARWLLSDLLDWHRRENKASWWRFYDLMTKSDDELYEEKEPIAHLEYVGIVGETKRSLIHRYRFPAGQEHSIDPGIELHDPQLAEHESRDRDGRGGRRGRGPARHQAAQDVGRPASERPWCHSISIAPWPSRTRCCASVSGSPTTASKVTQPSGARRATCCCAARHAWRAAPTAAIW